MISKTAPETRSGKRQEAALIRAAVQAVRHNIDASRELLAQATHLSLAHGGGTRREDDRGPPRC